MKERKMKIAGWGNTLSGKKIEFGGQTRYRLGKDETLLMLAVRSTRKALERATMGISDMDCIVRAMATPLQAIPCNVALVHEQLAKGLDIPAMGINTICTSFISTLDVISCLTEVERYKNVLIISGDTASVALNPRQEESYELFSDGASACILTGAGEQKSSKIPYSCQKTWSEGAHGTGIRGGGGMVPAFSINEENHEDFYFDMKSERILKLSIQNLPGFVEQCLKEAGVKRENIDLVVPYQASRVLDIIVPRLSFRKGTYIDRVSQYGNMISALVPYALCEAIEEERAGKGGLALLIGTAVGLTANFLLMRT